jgi:methyltransferase (TIGR00027 family)
MASTFGNAELYAGMDLLGVTSQWAAAERAKESERCDRLFFDPLARVFAGEEGCRLRDEMAGNAGGDSSYPAIRTRFFDEWALSAAQSVRQIVLVAAGMDARAFRLAWPPGATLYEVDRHAVLAEKARLLTVLRPRELCERRVVAADLLREAWEERLLAAGFRIDLPAAFLVEGLTAYLDVGQARGLLQRIRGLVAPGSRLGVDFIGESFLRSPFTQRYLGRLRELGMPWLFGTDSPDELLAEHGWTANTTMPGEPAANWGRWPFPPARGASPWPKVYLVRAVLPVMDQALGGGTAAPTREEAAPD